MTCFAITIVEMQPSSVHPYCHAEESVKPTKHLLQLRMMPERLSLSPTCRAAQPRMPVRRIIKCSGIPQERLRNDVVSSQTDYQSLDKSPIAGLVKLIKSSFFCRVQPFSCFSLDIALCMSDVVSKYTNLFNLYLFVKPGKSLCS